MKRNSDEIIKQAIGKNTKEIAVKLGVGKDLVMQWKNGNTKNDIDRVIKLYKETGDIDIIKYICVHADGYFVKNCGDKHLDTRVQDIHIEINKTVKVLLEAYEDEHISLNEVFMILGRWGELKNKMDGLVNDLLKEYAIEHDIEINV